MSDIRYSNLLMVISWYGHSCFKIVSGDLTIIIDPFDKSIGLRPPFLTADIVCVSHDHSDHNNINSLSGHPLLIKGPGEFETKGINIFGIESFHDNKQGQERGLNTIYVIQAEGIKLCHLGDLGQDELTENQLEVINGVDVLFVPVGGKYTIGATRAANLVNQLEPNIVIPMHYKLPNLKIDIESVDRFLKETGAGKKQPVDKLTIKKKNLPEHTEIIVMKV